MYQASNRLHIYRLAAQRPRTKSGKNGIFTKFRSPSSLTEAGSKTKRCRPCVCRDNLETSSSSSSRKQATSCRREHRVKRHSFLCRSCSFVIGTQRKMLCHVLLVAHTYSHDKDGKDLKLMSTQANDGNRSFSAGF